ncbi:Uncharacterised protein [Mycobacteroides abscessus subsp. abscessus]|nr:Uncharacterised protein [Mycobacteroides abscessus subsp. abscessus]
MKPQVTGVGVVHRELRVGVLQQARDESEVVGVQMGDEHVRDVGEVVSGGMDSVDKHLPARVGVPAGVDEREPAVCRRQCVDEDVAQRVLGDEDRDRPEARPDFFDGRHFLTHPGLALAMAGDHDRRTHHLIRPRRDRAPQTPVDSRAVRKPLCSYMPKNPPHLLQATFGTPEGKSTQMR